ncbi:LacI family transcriptional regulator [bacterium]|nr:MAG: LacI family transcriptional regulator [bacterium]
MSDNRDPQKPPTLEDIARIAGVNRRTVRDAIQGTGRVAPATRENVIRITQELNYVPNPSAHTLAKGRTGRVVVLSGSLNDQYNANAVHLLESCVSKHGYETMLVQSRIESQHSINAARASLSDGIIAIGIQQLNKDFRSFDTIPPRVLIDTSSPDFIDHITLDFRPAVEEALNLMLATGRKRIAYVDNDWNALPPLEVRRATYLDLMANAGHSPEIIDVRTDVPPQERIQTIKKYIQDNGCPGAFFCQNDEAAIYTYHAIIGSGHRIPTDAMLVGCDGLPHLEYFDTPLSTIALPMEEICAIAFKFLQQRMTEPSLPIQQQTVKARLVIRKSLSVEESA